MTLVAIGVLYITFRPPWVETDSMFTHFGEHVLGLDRREREYLLSLVRDFIPYDSHGTSSLLGKHSSALYFLYMIP